MIETNINRRHDYFIHLDEIRPLPLCTAATSIRAYHLQLKGKQKVARKALLKHKQHRFGGRGVLPAILVGGVLPDSPNPDPISDQKLSFFTLVSDLASKIHTHFQTWRRSQDATYMFTKTEITPSLLKLERQQKDFLKFILNSQFMGVFLIHLEPIDEYAHTPRSSLENYTWFQSIPVFRPKRCKNPTLWGGTYLYGLYKGVSPAYWLSKRWRSEGRWGIQILALSPSALLKLIFRFYFSIQRYHLSYLCIKFRYSFRFDPM